MRRITDGRGSKARMAAAAFVAGAVVTGLALGPVAGAGTGLDITRVDVTRTVAGGEYASAEAKCPAGTHVISGGFNALGGEVALRVAVNRQADAGTAWRVVAGNPGSVEADLTAFAVCAVTS